ncbi:hypothetical protein GSI_05294 [Ganoderma sinense ZZ0214-1]|uniref:Uncharacterized protein n=1 Tax=Ganoderma sinense ZZ0214-1 TaxID=1077348 RepID=A0A2G8SFR9_9APHY|nr:hypothetical protein GSI_05294 [Ganoderma sinense ZZ0214-1]
MAQPTNPSSIRSPFLTTGPFWKLIHAPVAKSLLHAWNGEKVKGQPRKKEVANLIQEAGMTIDWARIARWLKTQSPEPPHETPEGVEPHEYALDREFYVLACVSQIVVNDLRPQALSIIPLHELMDPPTTSTPDNARTPSNGLGTPPPPQPASSSRSAPRVAPQHNPLHSLTTQSRTPQEAPEPCSNSVVASDGAPPTLPDSAGRGNPSHASASDLGAQGDRTLGSAPSPHQAPVHPKPPKAPARPENATATHRHAGQSNTQPLQAPLTMNAAGPHAPAQGDSETSLPHSSGASKSQVPLVAAINTSGPTGQPATAAATSTATVRVQLPPTTIPARASSLPPLGATTPYLPRSRPVAVTITIPDKTAPPSQTPPCAEATSKYIAWSEDPATRGEYDEELLKILDEFEFADRKGNFPDFASLPPVNTPVLKAKVPVGVIIQLRSSSRQDTTPVCLRDMTVRYDPQTRIVFARSPSITTAVTKDPQFSHGKF